MKTRNSLVSNSSTSSFICLLPKEIHDEILNEYKGTYPEIYKKFIASIVIPIHKFGRDMIEFSYVSDSSGTMSVDIENFQYECLSESEQKMLDDDEDFQDEGPYEWFSAYQDYVNLKMHEHPDLIFVTSPGIG